MVPDLCEWQLSCNGSALTLYLPTNIIANILADKILKWNKSLMAGVSPHAGRAAWECGLTIAVSA
jgi:hypothetical protein